MGENREITGRRGHVESAGRAENMEEREQEDRRQGGIENVGERAERNGQVGDWSGSG